MRVGVDASKFPDARELGATGTLEAVHELGLQGVFFRSILDLDPQLDPGRLAEVRARANSLGLYLEVGAGNINPYATPETPELRALGNGDYITGMQRIISAAASIGCYELWVGMANYKAQYQGVYALDRFRTDTTWEEQLAATARVVSLLAPALRNAGCRMNIETHEEVTTHEILRMIEACGEDVLGVTLDVGNLLSNGEDPVAASRRVASHVHLTHFKDMVVYFNDTGLARQMRACGEGSIDLRSIVALLDHDINLSIEGPVKKVGSGHIQIYDPLWRRGHPDLDLAEVLELIRMARETEERVRSGRLSDPVAIEGTPTGAKERLEFLEQSALHLRGLVSELQGEGSS